MAGVVHIPWYATVFRAERLAAALQELAPVAVRYGATEYSLQQSRDDAYRFVHMIWFERKLDWERFWESPELVEFRAHHSGAYQVPVLYVWHDELAKDVVKLIDADTAPASASPTVA